MYTTGKRDYSKYVLKKENELMQLIEGKDEFVILACNKCFKTFDAASLPEPEAEQLTMLINKQGKSVIGETAVDFLCNEKVLQRSLSEIEKWSKLPGKPMLFVISCGIGTQSVAELIDSKQIDIEVKTACDSIKKNSGHHGMALTDTVCGACGQCRLQNGYCPVTGCPKGLQNGPCGGSKNGKCEVDSECDCFYDKIGYGIKTDCQKTSLHENQDNEPRLNNYSKTAGIFDKNNRIRELAGHIRQKRQESFYGGVYLKYSKEYTAHLTIKKFPVPRFVTIPLSQHAGMSAEPIINIGDYVREGQKIGEAVGTLSSSVHASISGHVTEIVKSSHPNTIQKVICIKIESDGKNEVHKSVRPINYRDDLDIMDIDAIIAEKGIVGMGGAGFPTPVKLKAPKPIDTILLNGCESEPYITSDHRIMLEKADEIIDGLQTAMKSTGAKRGIIVISDNKSDAIRHMEAKTARFDDIFVMALWSKYPQGAERMLIARALGRRLEYGQRPYDVGAIVINVSTAKAIGDAFISGTPLIERVVTVSGERIKHPGNYMVRIGTPVSDILDYCGFENDGHVTVKLGGPMMGVEIENYDVPVIKGTNAIIINRKQQKGSDDCIRCGRCVDVCPMELLPLHFPIIAERINRSENYNGIGTEPAKDARNCIECGACDYICPSGFEIRQAVRYLKLKIEN